ncbi:MAG: NAD-binding protein [Thermodesulfobacteriota bacterium]
MARKKAGEAAKKVRSQGCMLPERILLLMEEKTGLYLIGLGIWVLPILIVAAGFAIRHLDVWELLSLNELVGPAPFARAVATDQGSMGHDWWIRLVGLCFSGTVLTAIALKMKETVQAWIVRKYYHNHIVICGLDAKGWYFLKSFRNAGFRVAAIEKDPQCARIARARKELAVVIEGDATDAEVLRQANVTTATGVICVCGEDQTNADTAIQTKDLWDEQWQARIENNSKKRKEEDGESAPPHCLVHIYSPDLCESLRPMAIEIWANDGFTIEFFNVFEIGATLMFGQSDPFRREYPGRKDDPHILVIGLGWVGERVVSLAAKRWWSLCEKAPNRERLRISVIDKAVSEHLRRRIKSRYPELQRSCLTVLYEGDVESRGPLSELLSRVFAQSPPVTAVYVCLNNQALAVSTAFNIRMALRRFAPEARISIVVRVDHEGGFHRLVRRRSIVPFGLFEKTCNANLLGDQNLFERLAQRMHGLWLERASADPAREALPAKPQARPWDEIPEEFKNDNRDQVQHTVQKLRDLGYYFDALDGTSGQEVVHLPEDEVDYLAALEHARWVTFRKNHGWVEGSPKDDHSKVHPDLAPWEQLRPKSREYCRMFIREFPLNLQDLGYGLYRMERQGKCPAERGPA